MTLFFGTVAVLIVLSGLVTRLHLAQPAWLASESRAPPRCRSATCCCAWCATSAVCRLLADPRGRGRTGCLDCGHRHSARALPVIITLVLVAYLVLVLGYDTWAFARQATAHAGRHPPTHAGRGGRHAVSLALALLVAGLGVGLPGLALGCGASSAPSRPGVGRCAISSRSPRPPGCDEPGRNPRCAHSCAVRRACHACRDARQSCRSSSAARPTRWARPPRACCSGTPTSPSARPLRLTADNARCRRRPRRLRPSDSQGTWEVDPNTRPVSGAPFSNNAPV